MLLYPGFTALDLVGPQYAFGCTLGLNVHLVAKTRDPVESDTKLSIVPTMTLAECPRDFTVLFVPGGTSGTLDAIRDDETLSFVVDRGARATWVTSVCTGSLVLGAAGLLKGYRATSHWVARDLLREVGAEPVDERVVIDRNRVTGAGVTAGIDFGLALVGHLRGENYARITQLLAEYSPQPPFRAGTPAEAGPETTKVLADMFVGFRQKASATLDSAKRLKTRDGPR
jgi:cyclohexyl-isocyanide hydratase